MDECTEGGKKLLARAVLSVAILAELLESLWLVEFICVMTHRVLGFFYC